MSRSVKRTPATCWSGRTNITSKSKCNRIFRHRSKQNIRSGLDPLHNKNEALNVWEFNRDGLAVYNKELEQKWLRK